MKLWIIDPGLKYMNAQNKFDSKKQPLIPVSKDKLIRNYIKLTKSIAVCTGKWKE